MDREVGNQIYQNRKNFQNFPEFNQYNNSYYSRSNISVPVRRRRKSVSSNKRIKNVRKKKTSLLTQLSKAGLKIASAIFLAISLLNIKDRGTGHFSSYNNGEVDPSGPSSNRLSDNARKQLMLFESFSATPYKLPGEKYWTIGYGHTGPDVKRNDFINREQAKELLTKDLEVFEKGVSESVQVPITQNMFDALVLFTYNNGISAFKSSTLLKKLNAGDYLGAKAEFSRWTRGANKKVLSGLVERRRIEADLFGKDIGIDNKIIQKSIGKSGKTSGVSIGNYTLQNKNIKLSPTMQLYLNDVGGKGLVTSGIRKHIMGQNFKKSHASGNKVDIGLGGLTQEQIIETVVPFMKHPATVHVAFEGLGKTRTESKQVSKNIVNVIFARYPEIMKRVKNGNLLIYHWGWEYSSEPHIDILIDPDKMNEINSNNYSIANKNLERAKSNISKRSKPVKANKKQTILADAKQSAMNYRPEYTYKTEKGLLGVVSPVQTYKNSNNKRFN